MIINEWGRMEKGMETGRKGRGPELTDRKVANY